MSAGQQMMLASGFTPLTAIAAPGFVFGINTITAPDNCVAVTDAVTITANGGVAPYSYAYSLVSGDTATAASPTSATTTFSRSVFLASSGLSVSRSAVYRCTVTDSLMQTAVADFTVDTSHESL